MAVDREDLEEQLQKFSAEDLVVLLSVAGIEARAEDGVEALARRVTRALWWRTHTPVGGLVWPSTLDGMVDAVEGRAKIELGGGDVWSRLERLSTLCGAADDPDPELLRKVAPGLPWASMAGTTAAGGAAGVRQLSLWALRLTSGEIGRWLPLIPKVGPIYMLVRQGVRTAARVSAPVGAALALASINGALGADYARALPILVGIGALHARLNPDAS